MSWERFHFNCRMLKKSLERGFDIKSSYKKTKKLRVSEEYGNSIKPGSLSDTLLIELINFNQANSGAVENAVDIYGKLNFSSLLEIPNRIRRVSIYLTYLTIIFFFMCTIYQVHVVPQFMEFFESMDLSAPERFIWFSNNWKAVISIIVISLLFSILINRKVGDLFKFDKNSKKSLIYKYFIPRKLKEKHMHIIMLLNLPMILSGVREISEDNLLISHFKNNQFTNLDIANEISILISNNMKDFVIFSESFVQKIFISMALLILFGIFQFISSAYAPIFVMGDAI